MSDKPPNHTIWRHVAGKLRDYRLKDDIVFIREPREQTGWKPTKVQWRYMESCVADGTWKRITPEEKR